MACTERAADAARQVLSRDITAAGNLEKVEFENLHLQVIRLAIAAGQQIDVRTTTQEPSLLIALTRVPRTPAAAVLAPGQERWIDTNTSERIHKTGSEPVELLRFDLQTPHRRRRRSASPSLQPDQELAIGKLLGCEVKGIVEVGG